MLFENLENIQNCNFFVINSILMFFTHLDSSFIDNTIIDFLISFYTTNLEERNFNKYISLTGIIVF